MMTGTELLPTRGARLGVAAALQQAVAEATCANIKKVGHAGVERRRPDAGEGVQKELEKPRSRKA